MQMGDATPHAQVETHHHPQSLVTRSHRMAVVMKSAAAPTQHEIESTPPPDRYARGWHCLGLAQDYRDGKPHSLNIFGTRLVVYQGESGKLHILNAWCPHMGADLALGDV